MHSQLEYTCLKLCDVIFEKYCAVLLISFWNLAMKYVLKALKSIFDPAFPLLGFYLKEKIEQMCKGICFSVVLRA